MRFCRALPLLVAVAIAAPALAETAKEKLARLADDVFSFEDIDESDLPRQAVERAFYGGGGSALAKPQEGEDRGTDNSIAKHFDVDARIPDTWLKKLFERLEGTPRPLVVQEIDLRRDPEHTERLAGRLVVTATGFDAQDVPIDSQAAKIAKGIEKFLEKRPQYAQKIADAVDAATKQRARIEKITLENGKLKIVTATAAPGTLFPKVLRQEATPHTPTPTATGGTGKHGPSRGESTPPVSPPRREPRPKIRPAREVLADYAQGKLWSFEEMRDDVPRGVLERAGAEVVEVQSVERLSDAPGPLPERIYAVRIAAWWDELLATTRRLNAVTATVVTEIDIGEVPPPTNDYKAEGKRSLRFAGNVYVSVMGFDASALRDGEEQGELDAARAALGVESSIGEAVTLAIGAVPVQVVIERLACGQESFHLRLAGIHEQEARAIARKLGETQEITGTAEKVEPRFSRVADTFVIEIERR